MRKPEGVGLPAYEVARTLTDIRLLTTGVFSMAGHCPVEGGYLAALLECQRSGGRFVDRADSGHPS